MMKRYKTFSEHGVKKLEEFNRLARASEDLETLPSVVVVIDELADLMLVAAKEVEESICRVAQMGRAAGVHLVIATQRPSADVITGLMKANIPSRIAFAVASSLESRIILDNTGAEKLVGKGDMLYAPLGQGKPTRVQGCFISPEEIERVVEFVKQSGEAHYSDEVMAKIEESMQEKEKGGKGAAAAALRVLTKSKVTMSAASHRWTRSSCWSALQLESYAAFCCKGVSQWEKKSQFGILHFLIVVGAIRSVMLHWTFALGK